jgi:hypothetical protein
MDIRGHFHRKKIADGVSVGEESRVSRADYDENDTRYGKLLQCIADFRRNVTYFAGNLSKAIGN